MFNLKNQFIVRVLYLSGFFMEMLVYGFNLWTVIPSILVLPLAVIVAAFLVLFVIAAAISDMAAAVVVIAAIVAGGIVLLVRPVTDNVAVWAREWVIHWVRRYVMESYSPSQSKHVAWTIFAAISVLVNIMVVLYAQRLIGGIFNLFGWIIPQVIIPFPFNPHGVYFSLLDWIGLGGSISIGAMVAYHLCNLLAILRRGLLGLEAVAVEERRPVPVRRPRRRNTRVSANRNGGKSNRARKSNRRKDVEPQATFANPLEAIAAAENLHPDIRATMAQTEIVALLRQVYGDSVNITNMSNAGGNINMSFRLHKIQPKQQQQQSAAE